MIQKAFGNGYMGKTQTQDWCKQFENGRTCFDSDPSTGRPLMTTPDNIELIRVASKDD